MKVRENDQHVADEPLQTGSERQRILHEWDYTHAEIPDACVHELFEEQAARDPDAVAVVFKERRVSYRELNERANQVARYLRGRGAGPETLVGVCVERSPEMVMALLGVWKAGAAYVPLDPSYPAQRLAFMVSDANAKILLTEEKHRERVSSTAEIVAICMDKDLADIARESTANVAAAATASSLAYVMYTSGSTGEPKGAMITHGGLVNYLWWAVKAYAAEGKGSALVHSSISFDSTVASLYPPLLTGGRIELLPEGVGAQSLLAALRREKNRSKVVITPSHLELLNQQLDPKEMAGMTEILVIAGESLLAENLSTWRDFAPATRLFNEYGPTEATVGCCAHEVRSEDPRTGPVPIGRAIANAQLYVLDANLERVASGAVGELYVGGAGVARGYWNREELTREKFVADPFSGEAGARLYKTGDLVARRKDGTLEFRGRADDQVKVRGHRIELGEIEAALAGHLGVQSCAVLAREDAPGIKQLVAYVVGRGGELLEVENMQNFLKQRLPEYMVPSNFVFLDALPLTRNGKIDRGSLAGMEHKYHAVNSDFIEPRTEIEKQLAAIWMELLNLERVGIHDDLFELGGDSLTAMKAISRIQDVLGVGSGVQSMFLCSTIEGMANALARHEESRNKLASALATHPNAKKPAFWLASGNILIHPLLLELGTNQPFFSMGVKPECANQQPGPAQLEGFVEQTVAEIRENQPVGPYYLGGFCINAAFAFAVASQLTRSGQEIGLLALFEPFYPGQNLRGQIAIGLKRMMFRVSFRFRELRQLGINELPGYMSRRWNGFKMMMEDLVLRNSARFHVMKRSPHSLDLEQILFLAVSSYRPKPLACPTVIFRSKDWPMLSAGDPYFGWGKFLMGQTATYEIPGDHTGIFKDPNVRVLAEQLQVYLRNNI